MTSHFSFSINAWSAWMPGVTTQEAWLQWALGEELWGDDEIPSSSFLPAKMRRRLSSFTKTALLSVYQLEQDVSELRSVFASQHGDMHTAVALFTQISQEQSLSPALFTRSVFNANQGLFSIAQQNRQPGTAVCGGAATFLYALLDAVGQLNHQDDAPILVSFCDEPLPGSYQSLVSEPSPRLSFALLLSRREGEGIPLQCRIQPATQPTVSALPVPLQFLRWLLRPETQWTFADEQLSWTWEKVER